VPDQLYIDGRWQPAADGAPIPVINPATEEVIAQVAAGGAPEVELAVAAAKRAFRSWRKATGAGRAAFLRAIAGRVRERREELMWLSSLNNGKPLAEAAVDMDDVAAAFDYYADLAQELDRRQGNPVALPDSAFGAAVRFEPAGVAALIVPWNFPLVTTSWKVAPALAAGCTVVLKPSEITPLVELELGSIADEVGLPPGVLNIVVGTGPAVGAPLVGHHDVAKISFTGSNAVGEQVMVAAARDTKSISLELGGKSPILVFADSDLDHAVQCITAGIFYNCGQMCSATSRLLVEASVALPLLDRLVAAAEALPIGDPLDERVRMGPLTTAAQYRKVTGAIARGVEDGARLLTGGGRPAGLERGYFVRPTVFADIPQGSALWREEIFGPVLAVRTFASEDEAIEFANDSDYGLVATVVTGDDERAERVAAALEGGHVWINSRRSCSSRPPGAASSAAASAASWARGASTRSSRSSTSSARRGPDQHPPRQETSPVETLALALWATNLEPPLASLADWTARVEARMAEAHAGGADLLVMPEFACAQWLSFAPAGLAPDRQVSWLAEMAEHALAGLRPLPAGYGVALLPGTMPFAIADRGDGAPGHFNRAWLLLPDGRTFHQDKIALTPSEQNPTGWLLTPGTQVNVIPWLGLRVAIVVCLDIEFTALIARLARLDLDLILVPAKVDMLSGYYRVLGCAKARAIELQTAVAVVGAVGSPLGQPALDTVVGAAAVFIPCEVSLNVTGVAAALDPLPAATGASPVLYAPRVPLGACRRIRHGAAEAEVWPGSWSADHIAIADPGR
jgi:betaine-aldehyde dehydrogenase